MAPATAPDSIAQIPDSCIERNSQLFQACPPGVNRSARGLQAVVADDDGKEEEEEEVEVYAAACMTAMLINTDPGVGWVEAPPGVQPASYYRDLANHPNILATFVYTARRNAGFLPSVMGQQLSQEEWKDYIDKFNAWLNELDKFGFYIRWVHNDVETITGDSNSSNAIVDALSKLVLKATNEVEAEIQSQVTERIAKTFELATQYMVEKNITEGGPIPSQAVKAGFQHEAFDSPGSSNPSIPISFTTTTLSKSQNTVQSESTTINKFIFQLNSNNIIANAEALAKGTTLVSTKAYCDYINGPLDNWAQDGASP